MKRTFRNLTLGCTGGLWLAGCALPPDPPVEQTLGPALDGITHPVFNPAPPKEDPPKEKEAAEDAKIARRIEALAHYGAAVAHRERGEEKKAVEEFYKAALVDPSNEKIVMEVVQILMVNRQGAKLFQLLVQATKDPEAPANLHALLAASYLDRKKPELAKVAASNAIRRGPKLIGGYKSLVQVYRHEIRTGAKRTKEIRQALDGALKQKDVKADFQVELALMLLGYLDLDKPAGKELKPKINQLLDAAWAGKPKNPILIEQIARGYRGAGTHEKAAQVMEELLKVLPNNPQVILETARGFALAGKMDQAKAHLDALIKKFPKYWQGHQLRATIAMDEDEFGLATKHYREALKLRPRISRLHYDLISALLADDQPDEAAKVLGDAKKLFRASYQQVYFGAMIHLQKDEFAKAHDALLEAEKFAKKSDPDRLTHFLYFQLGSTAEREKNYKDAEKFFRKSIAIKPDYATALNYLGYMWADRNENLDEAKKFVTRALKEQPDNAAFLDSMAWIFYRKGNVKEALKWQLKAMKNSKEDDAELLMHLGEMYHALKNDVKARKFLEKAKGVKDLDADIKAKIEAQLKGLDKKK
jgi:tetratricopeptide (TPR) repeat protein